MIELGDISLKVEELKLLFDAFERSYYDESVVDSVKQKYVDYFMYGDVLELHRDYLVRCGEEFSVKSHQDLNTLYKNLIWEQKNRKEVDKA